MPANRDKLSEVADCPAIVTVGGPKGRAIVRGDFSFWAELDNHPAYCEPVLLTGEDPFLLMFTSGTTGPAETPGSTAQGDHRVPELHPRRGRPAP